MYKNKVNSKILEAKYKKYKLMLGSFYLYVLQFAARIFELTFMFFGLGQLL